MEISICAPSYKRPTRVDVLSYLPNCKIYVSNDEYEEYKKSYPEANIVGVDPKYQGNVCRIRNHIMDCEKDNICVIVDDDLKYIGYFEDGKTIKLETEEQLLQFIVKYSVMAMDFGVYLWGINVNPDKQNYREYTPFSLTSYIGSPFNVHIPGSTLRFDERYSLKEDYDFTLQHLNIYRKVLRVNKYFYMVKQMEQTGGCATYRNIDREKQQLAELQKKWGNKIVKAESLENSRSHSSTKKRNFDVNPIIKAPIKGI